FDARWKRNDAEARNRRAAAIAALERFLAKYPAERRFTPDLLFRLAELHFEDAQDEYLAAVDAAQKNGTPPPSPDYSRTVELHQRLIAEFPDYRMIDGAFYVLGYCLHEMDQEAEARRAWLELVCANHAAAAAPDYAD